MQQAVLDYLTKHWSPDYAEKLVFSPVPKGQSGDLALQFFDLLKGPLDKGGLGDLPKNPVEIGKIVANVLKDCPLVEKTEAAGPYLNLFFSETAFFKSVLSIPLQTEQMSGQKIVVEYSSPNTNKPLHLGHMRNHALGISVSNLLEAAGAEVKRVNIINDKGLALAKCMLAYQRFANGQTPESTGEKPDFFVGRFYVRYEQESKQDPELEKELPQIMRDWEDGKPEWVELWKQITDWVLEGMQQTYDRQGVYFDLPTRESDIYEYGRNLALKGLQDGVFKKREDGAVYIDLKDEDMGEKVVLRADGTAIYLTQDLSLWPIRQKAFGPDIDEMIHVVGDEQNYYFHTVFKSLEKLGLAGNTKFTHYGYGLVNLPEGRMKSREGTVVDADNLMDELHDLAAAKIQETRPELSNDQVHQVAEHIQNAAWKFFLLRTSPNKAITFDKEKSIDFHGATGPYLQYAGVRIKSILSKARAAEHQSGLLKSPDFQALGAAEKPLGVKILEWPDTLNRAAETKNPTYIVTYLLELAQAWSSFYADNSVLNAESDELKQGRLALAQKVLDVLETGLGILGIKVPERM